MEQRAINSGHRQRLKDKFLKSSLDGFHDYEILELLLTFAIPRRDVKPLAKELITRFKGLQGVFDAPFEELARVKGVGETTGILVALLKETASAYLQDQKAGTSLVRSAKDVIDFVKGIENEGGERFIAVYLNSKNEILGHDTLLEGALKKDSISPRKVIESAFKHNARSIIFIRENPKEKAYPTHTEKKLLEELTAAALSIDIIIHDHIINGKGSFLSGRELGWIKG